MSFTWKDPKDIWKGEGIYHLTFTVAGRRPLLGELVSLADSRAYNRPSDSGAFDSRGADSHGEVSRAYDRSVQRFDNTDVNSNPQKKAPKYTSELATTELSAFGFAVHDHLMELQGRYEEDALKICAKQFMPNHLHVVIWVKKDVGKSIRQIAQGFRIGVRGIAKDMGFWKQEDGHVFEKPFIRTLARAGQREEMIRYVHANPDSAWRVKMTPDLYTIRRSQQYAGLTFDCMGKDRLLDWPDRNVVALSRSLTKEQIDAEVRKALWHAERGAVTYCAAINDGEKAVTKAIREAGYPLVVMMLDGFPPEGTEAARFYHPGGAYHKVCGEGKLLLMAPHAEKYENPELIALTDAELKRKDEAKGYTYRPLPHDSKRWRMIAGNMMLVMIAKV